MQLGEPTMRLAISVERKEGDALVEHFKRMVLREMMEGRRCMHRIESILCGSIQFNKSTTLPTNALKINYISHLILPFKCIMPTSLVANLST